MTITETFFNYEQLKVAEKYTKNLKASLYFMDKKFHKHKGFYKSQTIKNVLNWTWNELPAMLFRQNEKEKLYFRSAM
jgi:hypothetical protein